MTTAVASCSLSAVTSTFNSRHYCVSSQRVLAISRSITCKAVSQDRRRLQRVSSSPSRKTERDEEGVSRKRTLGRSRDDRSFLRGGSEQDDAGRSQSRAYRSQREDGLQFDLKDQQVEPRDLKDAGFLDAVVKVYCTHTPPEYSLPWQKQRQYTSTGSAFMIGEGKLLTNAHCVEHETQAILCLDTFCLLI